MKRPATHSQYIVIIGCGRLGSYLANQLSRQGHSVVVVDKNETTFGDLSADFSGFRMEGDATRLAILKQAKLEDADAAIITTREDNINLMVSQIAQRLFDVPLVLTRVFDPKKQEIYTRLGIHTICPISLAASLFLEAISNGSFEEKKGAS